MGGNQTKTVNGKEKYEYASAEQKQKEEKRPRGERGKTYGKRKKSDVRKGGTSPMWKKKGSELYDKEQKVI